MRKSDISYNLILCKVTALFVFLVSLIFVPGCGTAENDETATDEVIEVSMVDLYYVEGNELKADEDAYQLKQPYSVSASIEEIMSNQKLSDKMIYNGFSMDEYNNVVLNIDIETSITQEELVLNKAAVVCSLSQINDIASVRFILSTLDDTIIEDKVYTMSSFLFYDSLGEDSINQERVTLYLPDEDGDGLDRSEIIIGIEPQESLAECVTGELDRRNVFPEGTKVNRIYVKDSICYVDFSREFDEQSGSVNPSVTIYALVNSLTSIRDISGVHITIDGERRESYRQLVDISEILYFEGGLLN